MRNIRKIRVKQIPTNMPNQFIIVDVCFVEGGLNYYNYQHDLKGYYCNMKLVTIENGFETYVMGKGFKYLLQEAKRFSQKALEELAKTLTMRPDYETALNNATKSLLENKQ